MQSSGRIYVRQKKRRRGRESKNKPTRKKTREWKKPKEREGEREEGIEETEGKKGRRKDGSITRDGFVKNSKKAN